MLEIGTPAPSVSVKKMLAIAAIGGLIMSIGFIMRSEAIRDWWRDLGSPSPSPTNSAGSSQERAAYLSPEHSRSFPPLPHAVAAADTPAAISANKLTELLLLPVSERAPAKFRGLQTTLEQPMKTDEWSREVIIPSAKPTWWSLQIDPPDGYYVRFADNTIEEVTIYSSERDFSGRPLPFRLLGKSPDQTATVRISNKPLK